jgi:hypothetical protein
MDLLMKLVAEAPAWRHTTGPAAIQRDALIRDLKAAIPLRIQNVADYLFLETDQEHFALNKDFPNLAPPWPVFFMSYKMPRGFAQKTNGSLIILQPGLSVESYLRRTS